MSAQINLAALRGGAILPSPAWRRQRLTSLCQQQVSFDELAEQIRCDPSLAGMLIGLANGAVPSGGRMHAAVSPALLAALGRPALIQALAAPVAASTRCAQFDEPRFWCHALAMACAARLAGDALQLAPADELFTCGLLANTGQLALATLRPRACGQLLGRHGGAASRLLYEESRHFGYHRLALSASLMQGWGLPEPLCSAVRCHAAPPGWGQAGGMLALAWLLKLASAFADLILVSGAGARGPALAAARVLGIDADQMETLLRHSHADWSEWRDILAPEGHASPCRVRARPLPVTGLVFSEFI